MAEYLFFALIIIVVYAEAEDEGMCVSFSTLLLYSFIVVMG